MSTSVFNAPLSSERFDALVNLLELPPSASVLDVGCGAGEMLVRIVDRWNAVGVGVDANPECIRAATARAARSTSPTKNLRWRHGSATPDSAAPASLDLLICVGATHAFAEGEAATSAAMDQAVRWLKPGGKLLLGDGLWMTAPTAEYLAFLGDTPGVYRSHADNVALGVARDLTPLHAIVSTPAEWDAFEWAHLRKGEAAGGERRERTRRWRDAYLKWGRGTMGFGVYLFAKA